jgi:hypothetical protein
LNNIYIESQALTINLVSKKLLSFFENPEVYNKLGFALVSDYPKIPKILDSVEKAYNRVNELCLSFNYKRATHYILVMKYLLKELKHELDSVTLPTPYAPPKI